MTSNSTKLPSLQSPPETAIALLDDWFDPIEAGLRDRVREFIQAMIEAELEGALCRRRYGRRPIPQNEDTNGPSGMSGPPAWPPIALSGRDLWPGRDRGAAGQA